MPSIFYGLLFSMSLSRVYIYISLMVEKFVVKFKFYVVVVFQMINGHWIIEFSNSGVLSSR